MSTLLVDEQIRMLAKQLKMPTFANYNEIVRQLSPDTSIGEVLLSIMQFEYEQRQENQNQRRLKQAGFPFTKTLEELDLTRYNGEISDVFINELASCKFIKERRNITMLGNPGRGKTHMAIALGLKACSLGMTVLFKNAASLSTELSEARDNYSLGRLEKRIQKADLLILDEMGYVSFDRYQSELLFKIIADRSERGSIIITTNLPFSEWTSLFENTAMVAAMIDRLTFNSFVLDMNGESYRLSQTKKTKSKGGSHSS
ncbi:IS21-like element helper ATPase IstB [Agathobacter ruminis]|uniref:AAA family ATPase n=1 Tax=Agathobacter ruminis TaxID=1712665 RepID=A0A2G3E395_9FIRM|nr:IS21-like element helper ATPase IstB [Agathobacter ruminis]MDC7300274.1 IS21-like element helper ATPase IstB [Agathobacter ruminis]PHU37630.1 AAA family ATPase [Agathobacter ruminis]